MISKADLEEVYVVGVDFEVPNAKDPENPHLLYMSKMNPAQQGVAAKKANAARVRKNQIKYRDHDDDEFLIINQEVESLEGRDGWITFLAEGEMATRRLKLEQEMSEEGEWADDDYLQGLVDAWDVDTQADYAKGPDVRSPETDRIFNEMKRFADVVEEKIDKQRIGLKKELDMELDDELYEKVRDSFIERDASLEWLRVFKDYQILYGVQDRETKSNIYSTIEEVAAIPVPLFKIYLDALSDTVLQPLELKS